MRHRCVALVVVALMACGGPNRPTSPPIDGDVRLSDLLGIGASPEEIGRRQRAIEQQRQDSLRDCMVAEGFEYVPHVGLVGTVGSSNGLPTDLPVAEFRRRYGYGIATGFASSLGHRPEPAAVNPNGALVEALSPTEREAYEEAFAGCDATAPGSADATTVVFEELGDELDALAGQVEDDSRLVEARETWVDCLDEAGYDYADDGAIEDDLLLRMNPLYDTVAGYDVPDGFGVYVPDAKLTVGETDLLAEITAYELELAAADLACRGDLDDVRRTVQEELEARFLQDHRDQLRELLPDADL